MSDNPFEVYSTDFRKGDFITQLTLYKHQTILYIIDGYWINDYQQ